MALANPNRERQGNQADDGENRRSRGLREEGERTHEVSKEEGI
jgi:hypothetical protein